MAQEGRTTTLARVAASAGVSVATVSKVLNGRADVGPETRARVREPARRPRLRRPARRGPARSRPTQHTVELVFHGPLTAYTTEILQGVLEGAAERKASVSVSVRPRSQPSAGAQRPAAWVRELADLGRRGVIDVVDDARHGDLPALVRAGMPLVVIDPLSPPRKELASVGTTNFSGGLAATQHLLDLGHRRVAYLGCDPSSAYNQARVHGFRAACEAAGVAVPDAYVRIGELRLRRRRGRAAALLDLPEPPTAVFAATDQIAAGVLEAARRHGARVPQDLSVVGFDDTAVAEILSPPLTTVRQPLREMGRVALVTALRRRRTRAARLPPRRAGHRARRPQLHGAPRGLRPLPPDRVVEVRGGRWAGVPGGSLGGRAPRPRPVGRGTTGAPAALQPPGSRADRARVPRPRGPRARTEERRCWSRRTSRCVRVRACWSGVPPSRSPTATRSASSAATAPARPR